MFLFYTPFRILWTLQAFTHSHSVKLFHISKIRHIHVQLLQHTQTQSDIFTHSVSLSYFPEDFFSVFINFELPSLSFSHTWVSFFVRIPWKQMWLGLLYICTYIQNEHFLCLPICLPFHFWRIEHYYVFSQVNVQYNKSPHVGRLIKEILVHIWNASSFKWHKSCI